MSFRYRWTAVCVAAGLSLACGNEESGAGPGASGGGGNAGSAGSSPTGGSAGTISSGGSAGASAGTGGAGGGPTDAGLDCSTPEVNRGDPIACNGACLADPGDENAGCRVLMRSFTMSSLVVDGNTIVVSDVPIVLQDGIDLEYGGAARLSIFDRASRTTVGTIQPADGEPHVRAVSPTQIAFINHGDPDLTDTLRVADRGTGEITDSVLLVDALTLDFTSPPREKAWFVGDTLYFQEYVVWGEELRSVPLAGGTVTEYDGLVRDVIDFDQLLVLGAASEFSMALQLYTLEAGANPTAVGVPLTDSSNAIGYVASDATSVYFLETGGMEMTLNRTSHAGEAFQTVGSYPSGTVVGTSAEGYLVYDERYLRLIPFAGGQAVELADFGASTDVTAAALVDGAVIVVAQSGGVAGSYLLEIARP